MDFDGIIQMINDLLIKEDPDTFSSSWILKQSPHCYRFIWKNIRTDHGTVDWDRVTRALEWKFQRRWTPMRWVRSNVPYKNDGVDPSSVTSSARWNMREGESARSLLIRSMSRPTGSLPAKVV